MILKNQYVSALCLEHYSRRQIISYLLWKLNVEKITVIPSYKAWCWKSFYSRKKKVELKQCFLLNLYFALNVWKPAAHLKIYGIYQESVYGWSINYTNNLEKHFILVNFFNLFYIEKNQSEILIFNKNWLIFKPRGWVSLPKRVFNKLEFNNYHLENYLLVDGKYHGINWKLICNLFPILKKRSNIQLSTWYLKVLLLRLYKFPIIYNYKQLKLLTNLACFSQTQQLPWQITSLAINKLGVRNTLISKILYISKSLTNIYKFGNITEYLIKKRWIELLNDKDALCYLIQITLLENPYVIIKIFKKASKIQISK